MVLFTKFGTGIVVENSTASDLALPNGATQGPETGSLHARFVSNRRTYAHILTEGCDTFARQPASYYRRHWNVTVLDPSVLVTMLEITCCDPMFMQ
jgi:hypothetical protein